MSKYAIDGHAIFREYITGPPRQPLPDFPDIINPKLSEFHFILAFATEDGKGNFKPEWDKSVFSPDNIRKLKQKYAFVKVVISIGGRGSQYSFNPHGKVEWLYNAEKSLKEIIVNDYHYTVDGIDINYDTIAASEATFAESIGNLIRKLKQQTQITVVSIAPSFIVRPHYKSLYLTYGDDINWVDYQFYNQKVSSKEEFEKIYHELLNDYDAKKLLAGFSTDPKDTGKISQKDFLEGSKDLLSDHLLPGIFVWDANDSSVDEPPFQFGKIAQDLLVNARKK